MDDNHSSKIRPSPQGTSQPISCRPATESDYEDRSSREDVEAWARAYTTSFQADLSKIPHPPKDVPTPRLYYLLTKNLSSTIMHRDILHDPERCIETLWVMEQNKCLKAAMIGLFMAKNW